MAEPLTGKYLNGSAHARPPEVEFAIDVALQLPREEITKRLSVRSAADPRFIRDEVIVHLIRLSVRDNNKAYFDKLFLALENRVIRRLPRGDDTVSEAIRERVVDELTELIVRDQEAAVGRLDMFECRFDFAMKRLIQDAKRKVLPKALNTTSFDTSDELSMTEEVMGGIRRLEESRGSLFDDPDFRSDLVRAIASLPDKERRVATLMALGMPDIDTVTDGPSISKEMGRSARMIQNYRDALIPKLRRMLVEGEQS